MPKQINFFIHPNELVDLENKIRSLNNSVVFFSSSSVNERPDEINTLAVNKMGEDNLILYLTLKHLAGDMEMNYNEGQKEWSIDVIESPVIEFSRCYLDVENNKLRRGRIYLKDEYYNKQDKKEKKSEELVELYNIIESIITKDCKLDNKGFYVSSYVEKWMDDKKAELLYL